MASWHEKILFKLRGAEKWPWTDATVYDYTLGEPQGRNNTYYRAELSYSFWIEGHVYSGIGVWDESDSDSNLYRKDDAIQIQYNPSDHPNQSYFPEKEEIGTVFYLTLIGAVLAVAAVIWIGTNLVQPRMTR